MLKTLFLLSVSFVWMNVSAQKTELDSIFSELDEVMDNKAVYAAQKELRISELMKMFETPNLSVEQRYQINKSLHTEYNYYHPTKAKVFLYQNIEIAEELNNQKWLAECHLDLVRHFSTEGLYIDAVHLMDSIRPEVYSVDLMPMYYSVYKQLYNFYSSLNNVLSREYSLYQDSLLMMTPKDANIYPFLIAEKLIDDGHWEDGRNILIDLYEAAEDGSHLQAMLANSLGRTYWPEKDYEKMKKYFAISAIADIKSAVREHESFRSLAIVCYETNDIERAYKYISQSMDDAIFTNFNIRMVEASQFFSIIEKSYQQKIEAEKDRFFYLSLLTGIIVFFLIIGIVYIYRQMNKLASIRNKLSETNRQLNKINGEIGNVNKDLSEANLLKETYITQFLHVCSLYVKKLDKYQSTLNKKAMDRQLDELYRILKSRDMIDNELKELYEIFDRIFFNLYPDFVAGINELLPEDERFHLKKNNTMSAELRIFALIRLGITDSSAIAEFLHYSIKTIYNYRTRLRNKALVPSEEFEERVKKIGHPTA